ncbi:MAG: methionine adenosyltransferase [Gemmatimonadota bacterium]|nr:methionine adenosyltransferase [Gemmatimonadota bacterium]MDE2986071.1 methionine adenosyltransferase [Gemmatimonadota bacterium]
MSPSLFTSESVTEGHPDKVADQISDAVVDAILENDPGGRVACETLAAADRVLVAGEFGTEGELPDVPALVRKVIRQVGYERPLYDGSDGTGCHVALVRQSDEIAAGVKEGGAGDQGMMFGFACDETPELMPAPIAASHALAKRLTEARKSGEIPWLRPDGKSQVTYEYDGLAPTRIATVVVSTQHAAEHNGAELTQDHIRDEVIAKVIAPALPGSHFDPDSTVCHVNPSGSFTKGGPEADSGLTGRKIIVDTYGGMGRHGGGAFSGKDATKVDRSGAYAARWAAKNLVAAGVASRCEVRLAYAIGRADPVQVWVDSFGTGVVPDQVLSRAVERVFDLTPRGIIAALGLTDPVFLPTAAYGHFGRTPRTVLAGGRRVRLFEWERTDRVEDVRTALQL